MVNKAARGFRAPLAGAVLLSVAVTMLVPTPSWAQTITGTIVGSVKDPSNLAVAGAEVTLIHSTTGAARKVPTSATGYFVFSALQPGEYRLSVNTSGFKALERRSIMLTAAEVLSLGDLTLEVGTVTDTVTVTAEGTPVQTASAERSGVVTSRQLDSLLIRGRTVMSLLQLLPGVVDTSVTEGPSGAWSVSVHGGRINTSSVTMDGTVLNEIGNMRGFLVQVSMDAVQEVKVLTSNFQAEYGRMSGANINLITKSGTREFHGMAGYFKRHEQFNANSFFNNRLGAAKPRYRYNTWVYNIGGPIYIPGKFNRNRDKLFFFWNEERWPRKTNQPIQQLTVPTDLERAGDFSQSVDLNGKVIPVTDPSTHAVFPGNRIPASRVDRNGQALLKFFPQPNFFSREISGGRYNYVSQDELENPFRYDTLRVDYHIDSNNQIYGTLSGHHSKTTGATDFGAGGNVWPQMAKTYGTWPNTSMALVARYHRIFSPTLLNEFNFGYARRPENDVATDEGLRRNQRDQAGFTLGQFYPSANPLKLVPNATFGGVTNAATIVIPGQFPIIKTARQFSFSDNVTKTLRTHTIKAGFYVDRVRSETPDFSGLSWSGRFDFGRNVNNPLDTGYAYSNTALGVFNSYAESSRAPYTFFSASSVEWFVQDNWKATSRLTLDYGVRFFWIQPVAEKDWMLSSFEPLRFDPAKRVSLLAPAIVDGRRVAVHPVTGQAYPAAVIGAIAPGTGNPVNGMVVPSRELGYTRGSLTEHKGLQLGPRIGFAYDPFGKGKTSIRGGFGIFYNRQSMHQEMATGYIAQAPLVSTPIINYGMLANLLSSSGLEFPQNVLGLDRAGGIPQTINFSFTVQQNVGFGTVVESAYVGSLGRHLLWARNINSIPFGANFQPGNIDPTTKTALPQAFLRPYQGYGNINIKEYAGTSNYHSLQVTANRRFASGVQFGAAWTWSKTLDYGSSDGAGVSTLLPIRLWNYGLSSYDRTHILKVNWLWDVPRSPWRNWPANVVLNNWQVSGIASFISGAPLSVGFSTVNAIDITGSPTDGARIVVTGNPVLPKSERSFSRNFRTEVFRRPEVGTIGNAARTVLRGPGINSWDIAVFKNFAIRERANFQFRCEMYNAFNHTQFSSLDTTARFDQAGAQINGRFGEFTGAYNPRQIQLALRFYF